MKAKKGVVYTPEYWADWAVSKYGIAQYWMEGKRILDPGCGTGSLLEAVVRAALRQGFQITDTDLGRLTGVDHDEVALDAFRRRMDELFGLKMPSYSLIHADYLTMPPGQKVDIVLGNPPWVNFADLSQSEKERLKPVFRSTGLANASRKLLLGASRVDIAALFVATALIRDLTDSGIGFFFLPLSLFRNEGAHESFRSLRLPDNAPHCISEIHELDGGRSFPGAGTRYGFAQIEKGKSQVWPIHWIVAGKENSWKKMNAAPIAGKGSPLVPYPRGDRRPMVPRIPVPKGCRPRQGVNSGGAASVFILEGIVDAGDALVLGKTKLGYTGVLPRNLVHPLLTRESFLDDRNKTEYRRWIFLPYHNNGKIMSLEDLRQLPEAMNWLNEHKERLQSRRGALMKRFLDNGQWWALLGVGPYSFAPWKIVWEAFGRHEFKPRLFNAGISGCPQGNQAMHAYLPFQRYQDAHRVLKELQSQKIEDFLIQLGGANTKSWAQPGRIQRLLQTDQ